MLTSYAQKKLLDHTLGLAAYTMPATVYAGLFTASPGEGGSFAGEVSGNNYARVELTSKMTAATLATGIATNSSAVTFPTPSASWGTITYLGVIDDLSPANVLLYVPITYPFLVDTVAPSFAIGSISLSAAIDGTLSALTEYAAKKWLDHLLGKVSYSAPTTVYLGLFSADPTSGGLLTDEIATGNYARENITAVMDVADLTTGVAKNVQPIVFASPTAAYDVTHFALLDDLSPTNMLIRTARGSTLSVAASSIPVRINVENLQLLAD